MEKIFITGGAGYVGSKLVPKLLELGYQVTVFDLMIYGENTISEHPNLKKIKGDIRNINLIEEILPGHDFVIHLACISNDPSFELNPDLGKSINLNSFEPLVTCSIKNNIKKFIYASSSSVYGIKNEKNVIESMPLKPLTDYSKYKAECEKILKKHSSENFVTTTLRPSTVCGFAKRQRLDVVVNILANHAFHNRKIIVYGGNQLRPNIHIDDMVNSYVLLIKADKKKINGEIFNVGYKNQTVSELANDVKVVMGNDIKIIFEDSYDKRSYHVSSEKIKKILGFSTKFTIKDAVLDLKKAFEKGLLKDTFDNEMYFNIKRMKNIHLK
jgi:nucleoside-diphosphate-sugar epimerase